MHVHGHAESGQADYGPFKKAARRLVIQVDAWKPGHDGDERQQAHARYHQGNYLRNAMKMCPVKDYRAAIAVPDY